VKAESGQGRPVRVILVNPDQPEISLIQEAASLLRSGGLVAFATETVYGLGANALDRQAVGRIFEAKGRPATNPLIVHIANSEAAKSLAHWNDRAEKLALGFWPGPLTIVLPRKSIVPDSVTAGGDTVALRIPNHRVALALLESAGCPVAAPSANRSNGLSPTLARHVLESLGNRVDCIVDAGPCAVGIESTVVDLSGPEVQVLRPGHITPSQIRKVLGEPVSFSIRGNLEKPLKSPGNLEIHYAPRTPLELFQNRETWEGRKQQLLAAGKRFGELPDGLDGPESDWVLDPTQWEKKLYKRLHQLDEQNLDLLLVYVPFHEEEWEGILDRLRRASAPLSKLD
jgi:L-threonylcarbamoyladenylate synthase